MMSFMPLSWFEFPELFPSSQNKESKSNTRNQKIFGESEKSPHQEDDWELYESDQGNWDLVGSGTMDLENLSLTEYLLNFGNDEIESSSSMLSPPLSTSSLPSPPLSTSSLPSPPRSPVSEIKSPCAKLDPTQKRNTAFRTPEPEEKAVVAVRTKLNSNSLNGQDQAQVMEERRKRDALAAKQNREKKKKYVSELEKSLEKLKEENASLKRSAAETLKTVENMETEIAYLKGVIANQSELSAILNSVTNSSGIKLCSSAIQFESEVPRKRARLELGVGSDVNGKISKPKAGNGTSTNHEDLASANEAGVCLHVTHGKVSLEFCASCSKKASAALPIKGTESDNNKENRS